MKMQDNPLPLQSAPSPRQKRTSPPAKSSGSRRLFAPPEEVAAGRTEGMARGRLAGPFACPSELARPGEILPAAWESLQPKGAALGEKARGLPS